MISYEAFISHLHTVRQQEIFEGIIFCGSPKIAKICNFSWNCIINLYAFTAFSSNIILLAN